MTPNPTVSVIVPCFNASAFLGEAIESALVQRPCPTEILVVDDRSTDDSVAVARGHGPRVRVVELASNSGYCVVPKAVGLREAKGDLVALLDADDVWTPHKLALQVPQFADPQIGLSYGRAQSFRHGKPPAGPSWPDEVPSGSVALDFYDRCVAPNSTVVARRTALLDVGGFDESLGFCEDYDLWLRMALRWKIASIPAVVMYYRTHDGQLTKRLAKQIRSHFHVERKHERAVSAATGLSIEALRLRSADRVIGLIMAEFYGHRNLAAAGLLAQLLLDEYPALDADRRQRVLAVQRRCRVPQAIYKWYDRWMAGPAAATGRGE